MAGLTRLTVDVLRSTSLAHNAFPNALVALTEARYHTPGDPWPMYCSLDEVGARAEAHQSNPGIQPDEVRSLWPVSLMDLNILDARIDENVADAGRTFDDLLHEWRRSQPFADFAHLMDADGILVPCAPMQGRVWNVVVFPRGFSKVSVRPATSWRPAALPPPPGFVLVVTH